MSKLFADRRQFMFKEAEIRIAFGTWRMFPACLNCSPDVSLKDCLFILSMVSLYFLTMLACKCPEVV
jgi:hypothetical protein